MVDLILLISGSSKRMGQEKALLPFSKSQSFVCHIIETYLQIKELSVYVVVNKKNELLIKETCREFIQRITFIINPNPENGRLSSIQLGIEQLKQDRGLFIQNIDNPFVELDLLNAMLKNYQSNSFLVPQYHGKNGHPLLLGSLLIKEMKQNAKSISDLKSFLNSKKKRSLPVDNKAILANINSPEEYQKWLPHYRFS